MRIDIKAAQHDRDWANMLAYAQDTEAATSLTGFWLFDHFVPINGHVEGARASIWPWISPGALDAL